MNIYISETIKAKATKLLDNMSYYWDQLKCELELGHALHRLHKKMKKKK